MGGFFLLCGGMAGLGAFLQGRVEPLAAACDGKGVPGASVVAPRPGVGITVFEQRDGKWNVNLNALPVEYTEADTVAESSVVICRGEDVNVPLTPCSWPDLVTPMPRNVRTEHVKIVAPATGGVLLETDISGRPPPACDEPEARRIIGEINGPPVAIEDILPALDKVLTP